MITATPRTPGPSSWRLTQLPTILQTQTPPKDPLHGSIDSKKEQNQVQWMGALGLVLGRSGIQSLRVNPLVKTKTPPKTF